MTGRAFVRSCGRAGAALSLMAGGAVAATAQGLSGTGLAYNVQHRVLYQDRVSERTGVLVGGGGAARLGPVTLAASGIMGSLAASADSANPKADLRATTVSLTVRVVPWLHVGGEVEARRFESAGGVTIWKLAGGTARLALPMGVAGLAGAVEGSFFPSATTTSGGTLSPALRATAGILYRPGRGAMELRVAYRFERFDFSDAAAPGAGRLEQFRGIVAGVGLVLGR